eukprot:TRINITY_DN114_c0_g2_i1.p6 TRINITY_DN114_c0_g2~~TRINITY_DN114_c0_g2_i1.p6  ORF type:complete len:104 (-),score=6.03 TRINITY_DN114_c0_g2_i1:926-1237(-)
MQLQLRVPPPPGGGGGGYSSKQHTQCTPTPLHTKSLEKKSPGMFYVNTRSTGGVLAQCWQRVGRRNQLRVLGEGWHQIARSVRPTLNKKKVNVCVGGGVGGQM